MRELVLSTYDSTPITAKKLSPSTKPGDWDDKGQSECTTPISRMHERGHSLGPKPTTIPLAFNSLDEVDLSGGLSRLALCKNLHRRMRDLPEGMHLPPSVCKPLASSALPSDSQFPGWRSGYQRQVEPLARCACSRSRNDRSRLPHSRIARGSSIPRISFAGRTCGPCR